MEKNGFTDALKKLLPKMISFNLGMFSSLNIQIILIFWFSFSNHFSRKFSFS